MQRNIRVPAMLELMAEISSPASGNVILDTESTGLGYNDEIIEISIISTTGEILLDTLVKPSQKIPAAASAINQITDEMVKNSPCWNDILPQVLDILWHKKYIAWNSNFDARMMMQTTLINSYNNPLMLDHHETFNANQIDGQDIYSKWFSEPNKTNTGFRRQRLVNAAGQQNVVPRGNPHRSLTDCFMVLDVLHAVTHNRGGSSYQATADMDIVDLLKCMDEAADKATPGPYLRGDDDKYQSGGLVGTFICQGSNGVPDGVVIECYHNCLVNSPRQLSNNVDFFTLMSPENIKRVVSFARSLSRMDEQVSWVVGERLFKTLFAASQYASEMRMAIHPIYNTQQLGGTKA